MEKEDKVIALIKYQGELVSDGFLDAKKSGEALIGMDELVRYFINQENPDIVNFEYELPVKVRQGSWETIFTENVELRLIEGVLTFFAAKYGGTALSEMAKKDFKDVGLKDIIKKAFSSMIKVVKLAKHIGTLGKKKFDNVQFGENNTHLNIKNDNGEDLWIEADVLELYTNCPANIFDKLTKVVEEKRELVIGVANDVENPTKQSNRIYTKVGNGIPSKVSSKS